MALELESLEALKEYVNQFPTVPVFYSRRDYVTLQGTEYKAYFTILAGKVAWKGTVDGKDDSDTLETFLIEFDAKKVKGWRELESLFDG